ncbi:uncharacterized protein LOC130421273 [Triplophysa dalaica]|uniref:uncharacterized protein LOC130421273 n=1 Tax=Triplophysa dalaica TaxID=1582913 RepID=UPI0024E00332|nr:uncharacterized protein LOC130421273 [Triplophysa dalaica]
MDINEGDEITYDYGGDDLPWRSCHKQNILKSLHQPLSVTTEQNHIESTHAHLKESLHQPLSVTTEQNHIESTHAHLKEGLMPGSPKQSENPGCVCDGCKTHQLVKEEMTSFDKCSVCDGPFSPLKWWGLRCKDCTTTWHVYCYHKKHERLKIWNESETSEEDISDDDPEYVPASVTDSEDDVPPSTLTKSKVLEDIQSPMMDTSHISGITANKTSTNRTDSTTVAQKGLKE